MHASSDNIWEDNKDGMFHLQKGHKPQKRRQDVFEKWYGCKKDSRIRGMADDSCIFRVYM